MRIYEGKRTAAGPVVTVRYGIEASRLPLDPRFDLRNHSPDGFNWGYGGSGPAQLALALLADALRNDHYAQLWYQDFKFQVVAAWLCDDFVISDEEIKNWFMAAAKKELFGENRGG